ncbi:MAG: NADH-quinone oxidoreductase subunit NuoK [Ignavibacteriales bacterium]|nr:NADH-quinone oxidoreductase subunit NuoK [Ignavibacteriales bacterium]
MQGNKKVNFMITVGLYHYLFISTILFSLGIFGIVTRKNAVMVLMGIELILNAANINFIAFARYGNFGFQGRLMALFVIVLAAAEAANCASDRTEHL